MFTGDDNLHPNAITFFYHNFVRVHQSFKMTPAMKAGIDHEKWEVSDMIDLIPELVYNTRPKKSDKSLN